MIRGVIFDVDGTLVDSVDLHARAWKDAFQRFERDVPFEKVRSQIGKGGDQLLPVFFSKEELSSFGAQLEEYRAELFKQAYLPRVTVFPKVRELFRQTVGDGKCIVLASSASQEEIAYYKKLAGIEELVEAETSADDAQRSKPHPDIFKVALSQLGYKKEEVLVVGDTPYDAEAAAKLGLRLSAYYAEAFRKRSFGIPVALRFIATLRNCWSSTLSGRCLSTPLSGFRDAPTLNSLLVKLCLRRLQLGLVSFIAVWMLGYRVVRFASTTKRAGMTRSLSQQTGD